MARAVAKKTMSVPAVQDYGDDAGAGFEDMNREDFTVPFLTVLQSISSAVEEKDKAKPGMLFNTVTEELFEGKEGLQFIPCHRTHRWNEWKPRDQGGGLVGTHPPEAEVVEHAKATQDFGNYTTTDGNDLVDTFDVWGLMVRDDGSYDPVILSFTSTKVKIYKRWATQMYNLKIKQPDGRMIRPPMFAHIWRLTTAQEESAAGKYYNLRVAMDAESAAECRLTQDDERYQAAKSFRDMAVSGEAKPAVETAKEGNTDPDDEIPF